MVRATAPVNGEKGDATAWPADINADYVSQTETSDQNMAGNLIFASGKAPSYDGSTRAMYFYTKSGASPITFAHGIGQTPDGVLPSANAPQPYTLGWTADATNIKIYHNAAASLTVSVIAWVNP